MLILLLNRHRLLETCYFLSNITGAILLKRNEKKRQLKQLRLYLKTPGRKMSFHEGLAGCFTIVYPNGPSKQRIVSGMRLFFTKYRVNSSLHS